MKEDQIENLEKVIRNAEVIYPNMRTKLIDFITVNEILIGDMIREPYYISEFFKSLGYYIGVTPSLVYDEDNMNPQVKYMYRILYVTETYRDDEKPSTSTVHGRIEHLSEYDAFIAVCKSIFDHINNRFMPESKIFYV